MKRLQGVCFALCFGYVQNTLALFCPSGQFALKHQCVGCHPTCWECNGHELFECTKCGVDEDGQERFFHRGRCRLHCPRGFYPEQDRFTCEPCMVNCELCADAKVCAKCTGNYKLQSGVCQTTECKEGDPELCKSCMEGYFLYRHQCRRGCPQKTYGDEGRKMCFSCPTPCIDCRSDSLCLSCQAGHYLSGDPELCKSCMEGYFLYRHQCRRGCPQKTYGDEGRKMCFSCPTPCIDCRSDSLCLSCQAGHYLSDGSCVKQCPDGTYGEPNSWRCESCHGSCQTCHGSLPKNCDSCPHGNLPMYGQCPTVSCVEGQYMDAADTKCYSCDVSCKTCFGPQALDCSSCCTGYFLDQEGACVEHCPVGYFINPATQLCEECSANCESCEGAAEKCLSCKKGPFSLFLHQGNCWSNCPEGYFESAEGTCEACDSLCLSCDENTSNCMSCAAGLYLQNGHCSPNCSVNYYPDVDGTCRRCPAHCHTCTDGKSCKACSYLYLLLNGVCKATCPKGYFEDLDQGKCIPCHSTCASCSGTQHDDCDSCSSLYPRLYEGQCSVECPAGTYYESSANECQDYTPQGCLTCDWGSTLQNGICYPRCEEQRYLSEDEVCKLCDSSCRHCSGPGPNQCVSCKPNFALHPTEKRCIECCESEVNQTDCCLCTTNSECDRTCAGCTGPELTDCTKCKKGLALDPDTMMCGVTGDSNCPPKTFLHDDQFTCMACHKQCESCNGPNANDCQTCALPNYLYNYTPQGCLTCDWGSTLQNGICYPRCEEQRYLSEDEVCKLCDSSCRHCSGPGPNQCVSCKPNFALHPTEKRCIECCESEVNQTDCCLCTTNSECDRTCTGCTGPELTDCTKCKKGLALDPDTMMCGVTGDSNCPPKTFLHDDQFTCMACHKQCESCNGPNANDCQTCALPNYLYNGTCLRVCSAGTFESSEEADGVELGFCSACDHVCATCTGASPKDCTTCSSGYFKFMHLCILHCPAGYYRGTTRCEKCDPSCRLCSGPGPQACLSCPPHMLQLDWIRQCVEHCPERFYQENDKCKQCHTSCKTCKDYTPQGCLTCDWGSTLQNGICYPRCEEQRYLSEDEVCKLCDSSCRHCSGPGPNQCVSCKPNFALHPTEKRCIECCESEVNQTDCCLCTTNSALCVERPHPEPERRLMSENINSLANSHVSATVPALVMLVLVITLAVLGLYRARARKKLCWKLSYERLSGSADPNASYRRDMLHGVPDPDDSADEADVVYTSRDGTVYRRYNFIKAQDEEAEGHEDQAAYLNKARC
ncbi:UNVERIFIED_CONTAM: hypothetical protein FKN15_048930 [Acipenser sinensis]